MTATLSPETLSQTQEAALSVQGMDCASCISHVEKAARSIPGVEACQVNLARGRAVVQFDPAKTNAEQVAAAVTGAGYPAQPEHGRDAAETEERRLHHHHAQARAWLTRAIVGIVLWLPLEVTHWILSATSGSSGHVHAPTSDAPGLSAVGWMDWAGLVTSTLAIVFVGWGFYQGAWAALRRRTTDMDTLIAMGASVAYGYSIVALAGYAAGWWHVRPELYFMESTGLLALISLGHWLEARARDAAGSAIRQLLDLTPAVALLVPTEEDGGWRMEDGSDAQRESSVSSNRRSANGDRQLSCPLAILHPPSSAPVKGDGPRETPVSQLKLNDRILIRPGDRVATDGVVIEGRSAVDESMLTGEPLPVTRDVGDTVIGGTINQDGRLIVRVTKVGSETALAQIVQLVEKAQSSKPPVQRLADRIAAVFVPTVLGIALLTAVGWYAWGTAHNWPAAATWGMLAKAVCSVLIIACPCALGLAIPAALMVGTGRGAKRGILIRDIDALQIAERIGTVVLDKTGTVTTGKPRVAAVQQADGTSADEVLKWAATAEQFSSHPLAKAIVQHAQLKGVAPGGNVKGFRSEAGLGVVAEMDGRELLVGGKGLGFPSESPTSSNGNAAAISGGNGELDISATRVNVAWRDRNGVVTPLGRILLSDQIKEDSAAAIADLHQMNLRTVLLTGDHADSAATVARQIGIDDVRADVRPGQKAAVIQELQRSVHSLSNLKSQISNSESPSTKQWVAMVGDGINDAPALAQADLGIAIGSGSDVAKETGNIVLVSGSLKGVAAAIRLSRATMRTIRQNLFLAFIYNVIAIPLAAFGLLNPLVAAACMALSDVSVIGNALLLRRAKIE